MEVSSQSRIDESSYQANYEAYKEEVDEERRLKPKVSRWKYLFITSTGARMSNKAIAFTTLILVVGLNGLFVIWIDYAPSEVSQLTGQCAGGIAAVVWIVWQSWVSAGNEEEHFSKFSNNRIVKSTRGKQFFIIFGCSSLVFFYIWGVFAVSFPYVYTQAFGEQYQLIAEVRKEKGGSRRSCRHRIYFKEMTSAYPDYICISRHEYLSASAKYLMTGQKSSLGINFSRAEIQL